MPTETIHFKHIIEKKGQYCPKYKRGDAQFVRNKTYDAGTKGEDYPECAHCYGHVLTKAAVQVAAEAIAPLRWYDLAKDLGAELHEQETCVAPTVPVQLKRALTLRDRKVQWQMASEAPIAEQTRVLNEKARVLLTYLYRQP